MTSGAAQTFRNRGHRVRFHANGIATEVPALPWFARSGLPACVLMSMNPMHHFLQPRCHQRDQAAGGDWKQD